MERPNEYAEDTQDIDFQQRYSEAEQPEVAKFLGHSSPKVTKAFSYLRVSGKGQVGGDGFPRQRASIRTYAAFHSIKIVHEYRDEGVSGTIETMDRPAWKEMMVALLADGVRTIIVERLDRLARALRVQEAAIDDLQKAGFTLISVAEPDLMADDPDRVMIRQILGAVAQQNKSTIVLKLRASRVRIRDKGLRCEGRKPYGTREGEAETLDLIKTLRANGATYNAIAQALNERGLRIRSGGEWKAVNVQQILFQRRIPASSM